ARVLPVIRLASSPHERMVSAFSPYLVSVPVPQVNLLLAPPPLSSAGLVILASTDTTSLPAAAFTTTLLRRARVIPVAGAPVMGTGALVPVTKSLNTPTLVPTISTEISLTAASPVTVSTLVPASYAAVIAGTVRSSSPRRASRARRELMARGRGRRRRDESRERGTVWSPGAYGFRRRGELANQGNLWGLPSRLTTHFK